MNKYQPLAVIGSGMVTAAGFNARSTAAAVRAGVSGTRRDNIWDPTTGDYMAVGRPHTPQWWEGPDMLAALAAPAVLECLDVLPESLTPQEVPILILLSAIDRPFREPDLSQIVTEELEKRLGYTLPSGSQVLEEGRSGVFAALERCVQLIQSKEAKYVVVVGIDSFLRQRVVNAYIDRRRILTADNSNGFIPGEAACAVLVATQNNRAVQQLQIIGYAKSHEKGTIENEEPLSGDGLTNALRAALNQARIEMKDTDQWWTDQNAEAYKARECTVAQIRLERRTDPTRRTYQIYHPIEYLGEIGAAIAPCLLGLALAAGRGGYAHGYRSLLTVSEDSGERVAMVLHYERRS